MEVACISRLHGSIFLQEAEGLLMGPLSLPVLLRPRYVTGCDEASDPIVATSEALAAQSRLPTNGGLGLTSRTPLLTMIGVGLHPTTRTYQQELYTADRQEQIPHPRSNDTLHQNLVASSPWFIRFTLSAPTSILLSLLGKGLILYTNPCKPKLLRESASDGLVVRFLRHFMGDAFW